MGTAKGKAPGGRECRYPLHALYEEMVRRFRERGSYKSHGTMEKCYSLLLAILRKKGYMRPHEIVDELLHDPGYAELKDIKRIVFYNLGLLREIGMVKATSLKNTEGYHLAEELVPRISRPTPMRPPMITDPRVKPLIASWNKIALLREVAKEWGIPSIAHSLVYEFSALLRYNDRLFQESNEEGSRRLYSIEDDVTRLIDAYAAYASIGMLPEGEAELFLNCEKKVMKFCKRIWWRYGGK
jgi:hypothetical protein